jgi:hypothetical protein
MLNNNVGNYQENGNVLFLILIAVALFAALSYAVTQSTRGGGDAGREKSVISIASTLQQAAAIKQAVLRMKLINGCDDNDISFHSSQFPYTHFQHTPSAPDTCNIFHGDGGGVAFTQPDLSLLDSSKSATIDYGNWSLTGGVQFVGAGDVDGSAGCPGCDLTLILASLTQDVCQEINDNLGISGIPTYGDSVETGSFPSILFSGTYAAWDTVNVDYNTQGCFEELNDDQRYLYFNVLIER